MRRVLKSMGTNLACTSPPCLAGGIYICCARVRKPKTPRRPWERLRFGVGFVDRAEAGAFVLELESRERQSPLRTAA